MPKAKIKRLYLIPILSKALDVLELLEQSHAPVTLEDVYQKTQISKTSVYRILKTLVHRGYVAQAQNGLYRLVSRPRRLRFGFAAQSGEMPFSVAVAQSITQAAAAAGVEMLMLDNRYDPDIAIQNAEIFVEKRVDLVLEFQVEERVAPRVAHIFKKADIPLVAIDVPHPNATYFGVDNFDVGYEAGTLLAQHALRKWKGKVDWILGIGFSEAGSFVEARVTGAFDGIRERMPELPADRFLRLEGRGMRQPSQFAVADFLRSQRKGQRIPGWPRQPTRARWACWKQRGRRTANRSSRLPGRIAFRRFSKRCARARARSSVRSVKHEAESYGPRLIQLGIALFARLHRSAVQLCMRHRVVTPENLGAPQEE